MIRGFYAGTTGILSQQKNMDTIANNVANSSTTAYKAQQACFSTLMYQGISGGGGNENRVQCGSGTRVVKTSINFRQGELVSTGIPTDFAIIGDGFFAIKNDDEGSITYTRDGSFQIGLDNDKPYLTNGSGGYVLDESGGKIEAEMTSDNSFDLSKIGIFRFANQYGLELMGGNQYLATKQSGVAEPVKDSNVRQGYLEASGVNMAQEMVKMIEASKSFSFGSRVIQTTDDMEKIINQLR